MFFTALIFTALPTSKVPFPYHFSLNQAVFSPSVPMPRLHFLFNDLRPILYLSEFFSVLCHEDVLDFHSYS